MVDADTWYICYTCQRRPLYEAAYAEETWEHFVTKCATCGGYKCKRCAERRIKCQKRANYIEVLMDDAVYYHAQFAMDCLSKNVLEARQSLKNLNGALKMAMEETQRSVSRSLMCNESLDDPVYWRPLSHTDNFPPPPESAPTGGG
jgi:hypothetical protein